MNTFTSHLSSFYTFLICMVDTAFLPTVKNENCKHFKCLWCKCHSHEIYQFSLHVIEGYTSFPKDIQIMVLTGREHSGCSLPNSQLHPLALGPVSPLLLQYYHLPHMPPVLSPRLNYFKVKWNYFGKIKLAESKRALNILKV